MAGASSCTIGGRIVVRWGPPPRESVRVLGPESPPEARRGESCERPPQGALLCRVEPESAAPAPPPLVTRCRGERCEVRSAAQRFSLTTDHCTGGSPVVQVEEITSRGALVSCETEGVECACDAPGYWVRDDGATPLTREVAGASEVVALDDGSIVVRRDRAFGGIEEVLQLGMAGDVIAERAFRWLQPWPRAVVVRLGVPYLGVLTDDRRGMDLFRLSGGGDSVARVPVVYGPPERICGASDAAGIRLRTDLALLAVVWEGESLGETAAVLDLRLRDEAACLERVVLHLDEGSAILRATSARTLTGTLQTSTSTAPITCTLFSADRRPNIVDP